MRAREARGVVEKERRKIWEFIFVMGDQNGNGCFEVGDVGFEDGIVKVELIASAYLGK